MTAIETLKTIAKIKKMSEKVTNDFEEDACGNVEETCEFFNLMKLYYQRKAETHEAPEMASMYVRKAERIQELIDLIQSTKEF